MEKNAFVSYFFIFRLTKAVIIPYLTVQKAKKAEKRDIYAKKWDFSFLPRFPKLS